MVLCNNGQMGNQDWTLDWTGLDRALDWTGLDWTFFFRGGIFWGAGGGLYYFF